MRLVFGTVFITFIFFRNNKLEGLFLAGRLRVRPIANTKVETRLEMLAREKQYCLSDPCVNYICKKISSIGP
jgi:hypothetical protein